MESYEVLNMAGLATLFGVDIRTLQNRPDKNLPPYSKVGAQRLFFKQDVVDWMRRRMNRR
jgi:phage terminase Nu1 subunit (DNA packaging protein)